MGTVCRRLKNSTRDISERLKSCHDTQLSRSQLSVQLKAANLEHGVSPPNLRKECPYDSAPSVSDYGRIAVCIDTYTYALQFQPKF